MCGKIELQNSDETLHATDKEAFGSYDFLGLWKDEETPIYYKKKEKGNGQHFLFYGTQAWFVAVICFILTDTQHSNKLI